MNMGELYDTTRPLVKRYLIHSIPEPRLHNPAKRFPPYIELTQEMIIFF